MAKEAKEVKKVETNKEEDKEVKQVKQVKSSKDISPKKAKAKTAYNPHKMVEVVPLINGRKRIGNQWYQLEKNKPMEVPVHVKKVLRNADAIKL